MAAQISYPDRSLTARCFGYFDTKFKKFERDGGFMHQHITPRIGSVAKIIMGSVAGFFDGGAGIVLAASSIGTFGYIKGVNEYAMIHLQALGRVVEGVASEAFQLFNGGKRHHFLCGSISISIYFRDKGDKCAFDADSIINRHMMARFYAIQGLCAVGVVKVVEFPFGLIAAFFAVITMGSFQDLNDFAVSNCNLLMLIPEIYIAVLRVLNPQAEFDPFFHELAQNGEIGSYNFDLSDVAVANRGKRREWLAAQTEEDGNFELGEVVTTSFAAAAVGGREMDDAPPAAAARRTEVREPLVFELRREAEAKK